MKPSFLPATLFLLTTATVSFAQLDDILANAGTFKPRITVSDHYSEKVVVEEEAEFVFRIQDVETERIAITVVANLEGAETGPIDADTVVSISAGHFDHAALLGDAEDYKPTSKRVVFPFAKEVELPNGGTREVRLGSVIYAWTAKTLTIAITCSDIVGAGVGDVAASDYVGAADPGSAVSLAGESIDVAVNFGDATGVRRVFLKGISKTVTRGFGSVSANTYEEFDLVEVTLQGAADVSGPVVKASFPAKPGAANMIDVAGTATDMSLVSLDSVTVNGVATAPAALGAADDGDGMWNWSIAGLPLARGKSVIALIFSDEDGNFTKVSKTYVIK